MQTLEMIVYDQPEPCPYLPGLEARLPLRQPMAPLSGEEFDERLAGGDRRCGAFLYRTACERCQACEAIRVDVDRFEPSASQRRAFRRGAEMLQIEIGKPLLEPGRVRLYNKHRRLRGMAQRGDATLEEYQHFLIDTCCDTFELRYTLNGRLCAVAVADRGHRALSAVYCYFDPDDSKLSLGTFSIMAQIELARQWRMQFVYLGLYVAESPHMSYKAKYNPHQRLVKGEWRWAEELD